MYKDSIVDIIVFNLILICGAIAYWTYYAQPRSEMLTEVAACMGDISDFTEAGYKICHEKFLEENG